MINECCCVCGVWFAMSDELNRFRRKGKKTFHCPNGHPQSYTETEADKLRKQIEDLKFRNSNLLESFHESEEQIAKLGRSNRALRAIIKRMKGE